MDVTTSNNNQTQIKIANNFKITLYLSTESILDIGTKKLQYAKKIVLLQANNWSKCFQEHLRSQMRHHAGQNQKREGNNIFFNSQRNCPLINSKQIYICLQTNICWITQLAIMHNFEFELDELLLSPNRFALSLPDLNRILPELPPSNTDQDPLYPKDEPEERAKTCSRDEKKRLAGMRSREKKKKYVESLQENVKQLSAEIEKYELQILKCKNQLTAAISSSKQNSNEHSFTFSQLQRHVTEEDPDIDRINLLLDLIQNRIGANARERQANLDYTFKQIINSMFPAVHRYLMHTSTYESDLFFPVNNVQQLGQGCLAWTQELYQNLKLNQQQLGLISKYGPSLKQKRKSTVNVIRKLRRIKEELKMQQSIFQQKMSEFREDLNPIQAGLMTVFGQKNKLRQQFWIGLELEDEGPQKKVKME